MNNQKNISLHPFLIFCITLKPFRFVKMYFEQNAIHPIILSSQCPDSRSLIQFANRIGGSLDPQFLNQCQFIDQNLQKSIKQLKQIPIQYEIQPKNYHFEQEIFLDLDIAHKRQFFNSKDFQQYNCYLNDPYQWNLIYTFNEDLFI